MKCLVDARRVPEAAFFSLSYHPSKVPQMVDEWNKMIEATNKSQYKSNFAVITIAFKMLDPFESMSGERKEVIDKVEKIVEGIYKDESIEAKDYPAFIEKYQENFEDKVSKDPEFKFDYKSESAESKAEEGQ